VAIDVRPAGVGDLAAVRRLLAHLHEPSTEPSMEVAWSMAVWTRILGDPNRTVLLAVDREEYAVGTTDLLIAPNLTHGGAPWAIVENVVVDPAWRSRGVGRALLRQALRTAADAGCHKLQLASADERVEAHRFYERLGFTRAAVGFRWSFDLRERAGAA
jgi:GNAT superfamily N-acetyltransferase